MTRQEFQDLVRSRLICLDGATGTELAKHGMPGGVCPEQWVLDHPDAIRQVHQGYLDAGSDIVYVPSFGGNRKKLTEFQLQDRTAEINRTLAELVASQHPDTLRFGDIAPTGQFLEPSGDASFEETVAIYREQAQALLDGGVSGFAVETMFDLQEARAALLAIREICDLPVIVTLTFDKSGRTMTGCSAASALIALQSLGADAFGCNCSTGPAAMKELIASIKPYAKIPLIAKPNAGMPTLVDGKTVFSLGPEEFAREAAEIVSAGASILGGCCGTTPAHIAALRRELSRLAPPSVGAEIAEAVSSPRQHLAVPAANDDLPIGRAINAAANEALQKDLQQGNFDSLQDLAMDQADDGAEILNVNCALPGGDENALLRQAVVELCMYSGMPLSLETTDPAALETALRLYPGRALVNGASAEICAVAKKYGALALDLR